MSQEERIEQLEKENAQVRAQHAHLLAAYEQLKAQYAQLEASYLEVCAQKAEGDAEKENLGAQVEDLSQRMHELEGRVVKDSHNSSKPPSSDGYAKKTRSLRHKSGKKPGGQAGHQGHTLELVETPDEIVVLRPEKCTTCQTSLEGVAACGMERRQRVDLPPIQTSVIEYQANLVRCPSCQQENRGVFPEDLHASVQYGPMLKGMALYLMSGQLLPYARTAELLADMCGCPLSPGTLEHFVAEGASRLLETEEQIKQALCEASVLGTDETGVRVEGRLSWLHTARTETLTHYAVHGKRGKEATDAIAILPQFHGVMVHDGYNNYPQYTQCEHALCNAHILRELRYLHEHEKQAWAEQMATHLLTCHTTVEEARAKDETSLPAVVLEQLTTKYHQLIGIGLAAQPPPQPLPKQRGRVKQTKAKNLLDRMIRDEHAVLRFLTDFRVPFTNNGSEQDLRMMKVQQKISGTFRSQTGPAAFCRIRGYFSTMAKQGYRLCAIARQLFAGIPFSPFATVSFS